MKCAEQLVKMACVLCFTAAILFSCKKIDETPEDPGNPPPGPPPVTTIGSVNADTISNHLKFFNAVKKTGLIPKGPTGTSLKISIQDTVYLLDEIKKPIKFLHTDTSKNVTGAYVQVSVFTGGSGGTFASYYYDVPELPQMDDNDTVSVILVGIDPTGLAEPVGVPPAGNKPHPPIKVEIVPHDGKGVAVGGTIRDLVIDGVNNTPGAGGCGLVLPPGDFWKWDLTLVEDPNGTGLAFYNDPDFLWGEGGQDIKGCCVNGQSFYNINCSGNTAAQRSLHFNTAFRYTDESIKFFSDNTFARSMNEFHVLPDPDKSDFCGSGPGVVHFSQYLTTYFGNYTVAKLATPFMGDSLNLTMLATLVTGGGGFGRSGGIVHQLDCDVLALIKPDREGGGRHEVSYFAHVNTSGEHWFTL